MPHEHEAWLQVDNHVRAACENSHNMNCLQVQLRI